jgi:hypothetical protein
MLESPISEIYSEWILLMSNTPTDNNITPASNSPEVMSSDSHHNDEINLVDLWLSLVTHKKVFFITTALIIFLAVLYIKILPSSSEVYIYKTDLVIGTLAKTMPDAPPHPRLIQSPETVIANLNNAIIPMFLSQQHLAQPTNKLNVSASIPPKTKYILLTSKGTNEQQDTITKLHQQIVSLLNESHQNLIQSITVSLNEDLNKLQSVLPKLLDQLKDDATYNEALTSQILAIEEKIRQTKRTIAQFRDTHSAMGTVQTVNPSKGIEQIILAGSVVLGLFMGLLAALFASFLVKVKEQSAP